MEQEKISFYSRDVSQSASESSPVKSSRGLLNTILDDVREMIEIECFSPRDHAMAEQIAMIIAEMAILPSTSKIRIDGSDIDAWIVVQVFDRLRHEHVADVISRFREATYEIKHIKTYLRTALYNSVLESEARIDNAVRADIGEN